MASQPGVTTFNNQSRRTTYPTDSRSQVSLVTPASRIACFRIFPDAVLSSSVTNSRYLGTIGRGILGTHQSRNSEGLGATPWTARTALISSSPPAPDTLSPTAADSVTAGCSFKAYSSSYEEMFSPLLRIRSLILSTKNNLPSLSIRPASPV